MTNQENNYESVENLIYSLKDHVHLSFSAISSYAENVLSEEGKAKVAEHIMQCRQCRQLYDDIKKEIEISDKIDAPEDSASQSEMSNDLRLKAALVAKINSNRDEIAEEISKILLPEISWVMIPYAIKNIRNHSTEIGHYSPGQSNELTMAAFSSGTSKRETYEIIVKAMHLADTICDLLTEHCSNLEEVKTRIRECVNDAIEFTENIEIDNNLRQLIINVAQELVRNNITG
ncbi:MAG: hypothetical protein JXA96_13150 [Sedimentisphaerales bacterium]|nr:hypothetical protein [Sedimentisphaerales bacterium]